MKIIDDRTLQTEYQKEINSFLLKAFLKRKIGLTAVGSFSKTFKQKIMNGFGTTFLMVKF